MPTSSRAATPSHSDPPPPDLRKLDPLAVVAEALERLRFGDIRLTVHEGRLVQIDVTEKTRLTSA